MSKNSKISGSSLNIFLRFCRQWCDLFVKLSEISGPIILDMYRAIADYTKTTKYEINLHAGDQVEIVEKNQNGETISPLLDPWEQMTAVLFLLFRLVVLPVWLKTWLGSCILPGASGQARGVGRSRTGLRRQAALLAYCIQPIDMHLSRLLCSCRGALYHH